MSLAILFHFLCTQHVSDINISIIRSLRLFCWITTLVVIVLGSMCVGVSVWLGWSGIRVAGFSLHAYWSFHLKLVFCMCVHVHTYTHTNIHAYLYVSVWQHTHHTQNVVIYRPDRCWFNYGKCLRFRASHFNEPSHLLLTHRIHFIFDNRAIHKLLISKVPFNADIESTRKGV